ncbi:MAG: hypothetical protein QOC98_1785 [Frankiaceae bacterium]|nr:hypothetical protein [Frankiaceae bacterium]
MFADLDFSVDLGDGPIAGRVTSDGTTITVTTDDADTVWRASTSVPQVGTAALPYLADRLTDAGLRLEVQGPQGRVASVGAGTSSLLGKLFTGSSAIAPGDRAAVMALALSQARRNRVPITAAAVAIVLASAVVVAAVRSRR